MEHHADHGGLGPKPDGDGEHQYPYNRRNRTDDGHRGLDDIAYKLVRQVARRKKRQHERDKRAARRRQHRDAEGDGEPLEHVGPGVVRKVRGEEHELEVLDQVRRRLHRVGRAVAHVHHRVGRRDGEEGNEHGEHGARRRAHTHLDLPARGAHLARMAVGRTNAAAHVVRDRLDDDHRHGDADDDEPRRGILERAVIPVEHEPDSRAREHADERRVSEVRLDHVENPTHHLRQA